MRLLCISSSLFRLLAGGNQCQGALLPQVCLCLLFCLILWLESDLCNHLQWWTGKPWAPHRRQRYDWHFHSQNLWENKVDCQSHKHSYSHPPPITHRAEICSAKFNQFRLNQDIKQFNFQQLWDLTHYFNSSAFSKLNVNVQALGGEDASNYHKPALFLN